MHAVRPDRITSVYNIINAQDDVELGAAVIGIDSISRLNFMRQMVNSYHFITEEMDGVVLHGFTKVGENTFPNVIPMLTGRSFITEHNNRFDVSTKIKILA